MDPHPIDYTDDHEGTMKSLIATWGVEAFEAAANRAVDRAIRQTVDSGRKITILQGAKLVQLDRAAYHRLKASRHRG